MPAESIWQRRGDGAERRCRVIAGRNNPGSYEHQCRNMVLIGGMCLLHYRMYRSGKQVELLPQENAMPHVQVTVPEALVVRFDPILKITTEITRQLEWKAYVHGIAERHNLTHTTFQAGEGHVTITLSGTRIETMGWDADGRPTEEWP